MSFAMEILSGPFSILNVSKESEWLALLEKTLLTYMQCFLVTKILSQYCTKWGLCEISYFVYRIFKFDNLEEFTAILVVLLPQK